MSIEFGHCIGVDPYYLTHKAQQVGYHSEVILAGRRLNDNMGRYIASEVVKLMLRKRIHVADSRILVLGLTFKENCPDLRNTRVTDIIDELITYGAGIEVYDPWADTEEARRLYDVTMIEDLPEGRYDAVIFSGGAPAVFQFGQGGADPHLPSAGSDLRCQACVGKRRGGRKFIM